MALLRTRFTVRWMIIAVAVAVPALPLAAGVAWLIHTWFRCIVRVIAAIAANYIHQQMRSDRLFQLPLPQIGGLMLPL